MTGPSIPSLLSPEGDPGVLDDGRAERVLRAGLCDQGCQMAKVDPFLSLDCARVEGGGRNPRKGRDQILQRSVAEP